MLKTNKKPYRLIKHAKISYSIISVVFGKFSCGTYQNGLNRGASKLRRSKYPTLKSTNRVSLITLVGYPHFSILLHRLWYLKNLCLEDNRSSFSRLSLKPKLRTRAHKRPFSSVCGRHDYGNLFIYSLFNVDDILIKYKLKILIAVQQTCVLINVNHTKYLYLKTFYKIN